MRNRQSRPRRWGFTLVELLVVIAIMLALTALAAAFMPRVSDSAYLSNAVDLYEQWLLSAKMRAKRDGLPTGLRFIPDPNNPGMYSQFVYIQQPDALVGGTSMGNGTFNGGYCYQTPQQQQSMTPPSTVCFGNVDFTGGQSNPNDYLVQSGDYLELRDGGGVHPITNVVISANQPQMLQLGTQLATITAPTANYRILRHPRPILGENPLQMPGNMAVQINFTVNGTGYTSNIPTRTDPTAPSGSYYEILFSPSGAITGTGAGSGNIFSYIADLTQSPQDPTRAGFVAVQSRTGFIGAYNVDVSSGNPYSFAQLGRESGL